MDRSIHALSGSNENDAIAPSQLLPRLNLAGSDGIPSPAQIARLTHPLDHASDNLYSIHTPDFGLPDTTMPDLRPYNLTAPGIDNYGTDPTRPDPIIGAMLADVECPYDMNMYGLDDDDEDFFDSDTAFDDDDAEELFWPAATLDDLLDFGTPQDLHVINHLSQADPTLPAMQNLPLDQEVHMPARPGDLAPGALEILHAQAIHDGIGGMPYPEVFMNQTGMNTARRRHMDLLEDGLNNGHW